MLTYCLVYLKYKIECNSNQNKQILLKKSPENFFQASMC